jgi:hypothetical protein
MYIRILTHIRSVSTAPLYEEGTVPSGLSHTSYEAVCDHMYCPEEGEGYQVNPDVVPTNPYAVK